MADGEHIHPAYAPKKHTHPVPEHTHPQYAEKVHAHNYALQTYVDTSDAKLASAIVALQKRVVAIEEWASQEPDPPVVEPPTEPADPSPVDEPVTERRGVLQLSGTVIVPRQSTAVPKGRAPAAPNNIFNDGRPYVGQTEIYANVPLPIYSAGMDCAKWMRFVADQYLLGQINVVSPVFEEIADGWGAMNADLSVTLGNITQESGKISFACNVMPGIFFACADVGYEPAGVGDWVDVCKSRLSDRNWRANHNFRLSTLVTLCAALSARAGGPLESEIAQIAGWADDHIRRTLNGDHNKLEVDRERSVHYQMIEMQTAAMIEVWLQTHGAGISGSTLSEITTYLVHLFRWMDGVVAKNPVPGSTPPYTYTNSSGPHKDIGPISKGLFGPTVEWMGLAGWTSRRSPFPSQHTVYKYYGKVPK